MVMALLTQFENIEYSMSEVSFQWMKIILIFHLKNKWDLHILFKGLSEMNIFKEVVFKSQSTQILIMFKRNLSHFFCYFWYSFSFWKTPFSAFLFAL